METAEEVTTLTVESLVSPDTSKREVPLLGGAGYEESAKTTTMDVA